MQHEADPDRAVLVTQPAEENTRKDRRKSLRHRFLEMDHRIGNCHCKDRVKSKRRFETMKQKAAKKEFEAEELKEIDEFPDQQSRAQIRSTVIDLQERVFCRKSCRQRHQINERQHYDNAFEKQFYKAFFDSKSEADLAQFSFLYELDEQCRHDKIECYRHENPPDQAVEIIVGWMSSLDANVGKLRVEKYRVQIIGIFEI